MCASTWNSIADSGGHSHVRVHSLVQYPIASAILAAAFSGGSLQGVVVAMGVNRGGGEPPVSEQPSDGGQAHAVHDALRGPCISADVYAQSGQSGFLMDAAPEGVEAGGRKVFGKHRLRAVRTGQRCDKPCRLRSEPDRARPGLSRQLRRALYPTIPTQLHDPIPCRKLIAG